MIGIPTGVQLARVRITGRDFRATPPGDFSGTAFPALFLAGTFSWLLYPPGDFQGPGLGVQFSGEWVTR